MNGAQLKNSILQWAIQGKLVPQNPKDEPASKLLERIRDERRETKDEKTVKKNASSTSLRGAKATKQSKDTFSRIYRENGVWYEQAGNAEPKDISDDIPFDIPENWAWCRLKDVFETSSGSTPLSSRLDYYKNGSINWVRTTDLNNGILNKCEKRITELAKKDYNLNIIPRNSICIAMYGGKGTIGKYALIDFDTTINQSVCAIFPNEYCYAKFFFYYMQYYRPLWMQFAAGSRKDPNINQIIIKNCLVPIVPLAEQKRIVAKLEKVLPLADEYGAAQEELDKLNKELPEALKKSILQQAIQGKLVPQNPKDEPASVLLAKIRKEKESLVKQGKLKKKDLEIVPIDEEEIPFEIPDSWTWCRLGDIVSKLVDGDHNPPSGIAKKTDCMMLSSRNINFDKLVDLDNVRYLDADVFAKENERTNATIGDVLFTSVGTIGRSCVLKENVKICFQRSVTVMTTYVYNEYLKRYFDSPFYQNYADEHAVGTAQRGFYLKEMEQSLIALPPLAEQKRIVAKLEQLFKVL